jgi:hypothetical protein
MSDICSWLEYFAMLLFVAYFGMVFGMWIERRK